jgi:hypothetical protein
MCKTTRNFRNSKTYCIDTTIQLFRNNFQKNIKFLLFINDYLLYLQGDSNLKQQIMEKIIGRKLKLSKMLSVLTILLGTALMIYMITFEDEPGILPLILIIIGTVWFVIKRHPIKK